MRRAGETREDVGSSFADSREHNQAKQSASVLTTPGTWATELGRYTGSAMSKMISRAMGLEPTL